MKALTIRQPWASLIALGVKTIETRTRPTNVRGRIAIHAAVTPPPRYWHHDVNADLPAVYDDSRLPWEWYEHPDDFRSGGCYVWGGPLGAIVATADLYDCVPIESNILTQYPTVHSNGRTLWRHTPDGAIDCTDQLPYGDFTPGRWAWLLRDAQPTTERCPACWGDGGFQEDSMVLYGIPGGQDWGYPCSVCKTTGRCDPIPAKGRSRWWEWKQ